MKTYFGRCSRSPTCSWIKNMFLVHELITTSYSNVLLNKELCEFDVICVTGWIMLAIIRTGGAGRSGKKIFFQYQHMCDPDQDMTVRRTKHESVCSASHVVYMQQLSDRQTSQTGLGLSELDLISNCCEAEVTQCHPWVVHFKKSHCWSLLPSEKSPKQVSQPNAHQQLNTREQTELYNLIVQPRPETRQ